MFLDRRSAGERLGQRLREADVSADIVLGIPRGGLPVARPVADALGVPLDIIVTKKLGAPDNPELAIGAVGSDGGLWRNEALIDRLGLDEGYVERERERAIETARAKAETYRGEGPVPGLSGSKALLVDDGIATGATVIAAARLAEDAGATHVIVAVPVASPEAVGRVSETVDRVIALKEPASFGAVGAHYEHFDQVSDEEARALLKDR